MKLKGYTKKQLIEADEVFLTSSGNLITPIIKIDNNLINKGNIGKITISLAQSYYNSF